MELGIQKAASYDLLKLIPSEIFISGINAHVYMRTKEDLMKEIRQHRSLITLDESGSPLAFSYWCTYLTKLGTSSAFYYHGESNADLLKMHFLKHCEAVFDVLNTKQYGIWIRFGKIPQELIKEFLTEELGFNIQYEQGTVEIVTIKYSSMIK